MQLSGYMAQFACSVVDRYSSRKLQSKSSLTGLLTVWQASGNAEQRARKAIAYLQLPPCCTLCLNRLRLSETAIVPGASVTVNEEGHSLMSSPIAELPGEGWWSFVNCLEDSCC